MAQQLKEKEELYRKLILEGYKEITELQKLLDEIVTMREKLQQ